MKQLKQYINEKLHISTYKKNQIMSFKQFKDNIFNLFDINYYEWDHLYNTFIGPNAQSLSDYKFQFIDKDYKDSEDLYILGADIINHPSKYSSNRLYINNIIDLRVYKYKYTNNTIYLFFIDHKEDKFYIYLLV